MEKYLEAMKTAENVFFKLVASQNSTAEEWFSTFTSGIIEVAAQDVNITIEDFDKLLEIKNKYL
jgi:hypothetical protein